MPALILGARRNAELRHPTQPRMAQLPLKSIHPSRETLAFKAARWKADNERTLEILLCWSSLMTIPAAWNFVSTALAGDGVQIFTASDPEEGLDLVYTHRPQVVMTDLVMPNMTGLEVLERITEFDPAIDVILMTAHYTTETAVEAIRKGAADYLNKPISLATLRDRVGRIMDAALQRQQVEAAEEQVMETAQFEGIVGRSPQMWEMFSRIRRIAPHYRAALDHRPDRRGQGTGGAGGAPAQPGEGQVCGPELFRGGGDACLKANSLATSAAHSPAPTATRWGFLSTPTAARCSWTRLATCRSPRRPSCCACCRTRKCCAWALLQPQKVDVRVVAATNKDLRQSDCRSPVP